MRPAAKFISEFVTFSNVDLVLFITGTTGSGKSTAIKELEGFVTGVFPGEHMRKDKALMTRIARSHNPAAPGFCEAFVRSYVEKEANVHGHVAVDGMPRSEEQAKWCLSLAKRINKHPIFVVMSADKEIRAKRLHLRGDKADIMKARLKHDDQIIQNVLNFMKGRKEYETIEIEFNAEAEKPATPKTEDKVETNKPTLAGV